MRCPHCSGLDTVLKDSRRIILNRESVVRRRRRCRSCGERFSTHEIRDSSNDLVTKQAHPPVAALRGVRWT
jgi:transcriptional repressor NrdR